MSDRSIGSTEGSPAGGPSAASLPAVNASEAEWLAELVHCPRCGRLTIVVASDQAPSMLGYGRDYVDQLGCGHSISSTPMDSER